jgi:outer membrane protein
MAWNRCVGIGVVWGLMQASAFGAFPTFDVWRVMPVKPGHLPGDTVAVGDCAGGEAITQAITLTQAVAQALCANPQTRQTWAAAQGQAAQVGQAYGSYLPNVNVSVNRSRDELVTRSGGSDSPHTETKVTAYGRNATLNMLLLDAGGRSAQVEQARQGLNAALANFDASVQVVFLTAAQAYFEAIAAQAGLVAGKEAERAAQEALKAAKVREGSGAGLHAETLRAQTAYSQAVADRIKTDGGLRMALGALANAMGLDARTNISLDTDVAEKLMLSSGQQPDPAVLLKDIDNLVEEALQQQPAVRNAQAQLAAAEARLSGVTAEGLPSLSASVGRYINGRPNTQLSSTHSFETLGALTLSVPLFEGLSRNYKIKEAMALVEARRADLATARAQASLDVWRNQQALQTETAGVAASGDLLNSGVEAYDAAQARYKAGAIHLLELLDAQKELAQARQERIRAISAWHLARLRLLASMGKAGFWSLPVAAP